MFTKEFTARGAACRIAADDKAIVTALAAITSIEGWYEWRAAWRQAYKDLTTEIRGFRKVARDGKASEGYRGMAQSRRHYARMGACNMMLLLECSKAHRSRLRQAAA